MKLWLLALLAVVGAMVWFRSGRRWSEARTSNLVSLLIFLVMLGGMVGLLLLVLRLF